MVFHEFLTNREYDYIKSIEKPKYKTEEYTMDDYIKYMEEMESE